MKILDDIIDLIFLIFIMIILSLMLNGWFSFFLLIITALVFIVKIIITKEKINSLILNGDINSINEVNTIESQLLSYSNDISKLKLSTKKDNVTEEDDIKNETHIEKEINTKEEKEEFVENSNDNKDGLTNDLNSNYTENLETVINDNTSVELDINKKDEKYSLTDEELKKCIRKLGVGRKASDKAKELARKYGYELKEGETFVSPK